jgi:hypothetical protein
MDVSGIRCAPDATLDIGELSQYAVKAIEDRLACLLAYHGTIAIGPSLSKAMWLGCRQPGTPPLDMVRLMHEPPRMMACEAQFGFRR